MAWFSIRLNDFLRCVIRIDKRKPVRNISTGASNLTSKTSLSVSMNYLCTEI